MICDKSAVTEALEATATMNDLPPEVMKTIFTYVGKGSYYFIGPVSKDFCYNYLTMDIIEDKYAHKWDFVLAVERNKVTTVDAASSCMELAEYCFLNAPDKFQKKLFRIAARDGKQDFVTMAAHITGRNLNDWIEKKDVGEITKNGDLGMLVLLEKEGLGMLSSNYLYGLAGYAAFYGHLDILRWWHQTKENIWSHDDTFFHFPAEARGGHLNIIQWGLNAGYTLNKASFSFCDHAARSGNLELVKWSQSQNILWNDTSDLSAVQSRNIELLQYLLDNGCVFTSYAYIEALLREAVEAGHIDVVRYCLENDYPIGDIECDASLRSSSDHETALKILKLLRKFNIPWNENTCGDAARSGNLEALKWARNEDCPWDEFTFESTIHSNEMAIVQYCIDNNCPFSQDSIQVAIGCEDPIPMLKLLRFNEYEWDESACALAASYGNLKVLRWLRYHNCPWDEEVCNEAVKNDHWDEGGYFLNDEELYNEAVKKNHYDVLVYAHENNCPWTKETYAYCFSQYGLDGEFNEVPTEHKCSDEIMEYIRKHNCPQPRPSDWRN